jgi:hypothetical protein
MFFGSTSCIRAKACVQDFFMVITQQIFVHVREYGLNDFGCLC